MNKDTLNKEIKKEEIGNPETGMNYKGRQDDITNEEILKAYDKYQNSIKNEGNPAGRLTKWKRLCEGFAMTDEEFTKRLKKAQEENAKAKENEPEPPKLIKLLEDWYSMYATEDGTDNDKEDEYLAIIFKEYVDIEDDIIDEVVDKIWNSSIGKLVDNKTTIRDNIDAFEDEEQIIKKNAMDWFKDDLNEAVDKWKKNEEGVFAWEDGVLEDLKEELIDLLYERAIDEIIDCAKDSKYDY